MIGIIGAMDMEVDYLKGVIKNTEVSTHSGVDFYKGELFGKEVVVAKCGIGKVFAAICTQTMINVFAPEIIINSGVAGGLSNKLKVFDVVVADKTCQHDMDTSPLGDPKGLISGINKIFFECDEKVQEILKKSAKEFGLNVVSGTVASGDCFVSDSNLKEFISSEFGALACEMEGGSIGHVCYVNNVPYAVLRTISDSDGAEMDFMTFAEKASKNAAEIMEKFVELY